MYKIAGLIFLVWLPANSLFADSMLPSPDEVTMNVVNHDDPGVITEDDRPAHGTEIRQVNMSVVRPPRENENESRDDRDEHENPKVAINIEKPEEKPEPEPEVVNSTPRPKKCPRR